MTAYLAGRSEGYEAARNMEIVMPIQRHQFIRRLEDLQSRWWVVIGLKLASCLGNLDCV